MPAAAEGRVNPVYTAVALTPGRLFVAESSAQGGGMAIRLLSWDRAARSWSALTFVPMANPFVSVVGMEALDDGLLLLTSSCQLTRWTGSAFVTPEGWPSAAFEKASCRLPSSATRGGSSSWPARSSNIAPGGSSTRSSPRGRSAGGSRSFRRVSRSSRAARGAGPTGSSSRGGRTRSERRSLRPGGSGSPAGASTRGPSGGRRGWVKGAGGTRDPWGRPARPISGRRGRSSRREASSTAAPGAVSSSGGRRFAASCPSSRAGSGRRGESYRTELLLSNSGAVPVTARLELRAPNGIAAGRWTSEVELPPGTGRRVEDLLALFPPGVPETGSLAIDFAGAVRDEDVWAGADVVALRNGRSTRTHVPAPQWGSGPGYYIEEAVGPLPRPRPFGADERRVGRRRRRGTRWTALERLPPRGPRVVAAGPAPFPRPAGAVGAAPACGAAAGLARRFVPGPLRADLLRRPELLRRERVDRRAGPRRLRRGGRPGERRRSTTQFETLTLDVDRSSLFFPAVVRSGGRDGLAWSSELRLGRYGGSAGSSTVRLRFRGEIGGERLETNWTLRLPAGQTVRLDVAAEVVRETGLEDTAQPVVGTLVVAPEETGWNPLFGELRVSGRKAGVPGAFGVVLPGLAAGRLAASRAIVPALSNDARLRSNLAIANASPPGRRRSLSASSFAARPTARRSRRGRRLSSRGSGRSGTTSAARFRARKATSGPSFDASRGGALRGLRRRPRSRQRRRRRAADDRRRVGPPAAFSAPRRLGWRRRGVRGWRGERRGESRVRRWTRFPGRSRAMIGTMTLIPLSPIDYVFTGRGAYPIEFVFAYDGAIDAGRLEESLRRALEAFPPGSSRFVRLSGRRARLRAVRGGLHVPRRAVADRLRRRRNERRSSSTRSTGAKGSRSGGSS